MATFQPIPCIRTVAFCVCFCCISVEKVAAGTLDEPINHRSAERIRAEATVAENADRGDILCSLKTQFPQLSQFQLVQERHPLPFRVSRDGEVIVHDSTALDHEERHLWTLTVRATRRSNDKYLEQFLQSLGEPKNSADSDALRQLSHSAVVLSIRVRVTDVNESPLVRDSLLEIAQLSPEGASEGTAVGAPLVHDPDRNEKLTYAIICSNLQGVSIHPESGQIRVDADSDFRAGPTAGSIQVAVTDSAGNVATGIVDLRWNPAASSDTASNDVVVASTDVEAAQQFSGSTNAQPNPIAVTEPELHTPEMHAIELSQQGVSPPQLSAAEPRKTEPRGTQPKSTATRNGASETLVPDAVNGRTEIAAGNENDPKTPTTFAETSGSVKPSTIALNAPVENAPVPNAPVESAFTKVRIGLTQPRTPTIGWANTETDTVETNAQGRGANRVAAFLAAFALLVTGVTTGVIYWRARKARLAAIRKVNDDAKAESAQRSAFNEINPDAEALTPEVISEANASKSLVSAPAAVPVEIPDEIDPHASFDPESLIDESLFEDQNSGNDVGSANASFDAGSNLLTGQILEEILAPVSDPAGFGNLSSRQQLDAIHGQLCSAEEPFGPAAALVKHAQVTAQAQVTEADTIVVPQPEDLIVATCDLSESHREESELSVEDLAENPADGFTEDLEHVDLSERILDDTILDEAILDEAILDEAILDEAILDEAIDTVANDSRFECLETEFNQEFEAEFENDSSLMEESSFSHESLQDEAEAEDSTEFQLEWDREIQRYVKVPKAIAHTPEIDSSDFGDSHWSSDDEPATDSYDPESEENTVRVTNLRAELADLFDLHTRTKQSAATHVEPANDALVGEHVDSPQQNEESGSCPEESHLDSVARYLSQLLERSKEKESDVDIFADRRKGSQAKWDGVDRRQSEKPSFKPPVKSYIESYLENHGGKFASEAATAESLTAIIEPEPERLRVERRPVDIQKIRQHMDSLRIVATQSVETALASYRVRQAKGRLVWRTMLIGGLIVITGLAVSTNVVRTFHLESLNWLMCALILLCMTELCLRIESIRKHRRALRLRVLETPKTAQRKLDLMELLPSESEAGIELAEK